jgi:hypothetical protein
MGRGRALAGYFERGRCEVWFDIEAGWALTSWKGTGARVVGTTDPTCQEYQDQLADAARLGYGHGESAVRLMNGHHDPLHTLLMVELFGLNCSPTLEAVSEKQAWCGWKWEEGYVLKWQEWLNHPEMIPPGQWGSRLWREWADYFRGILHG